MKKVIGHPNLVRDSNGAIQVVGKSADIRKIREKRERELSFEQRLSRIEQILEKLIITQKNI